MKRTEELSAQVKSLQQDFGKKVNDLSKAHGKMSADQTQMRLNYDLLCGETENLQHSIGTAQENEEVVNEKVRGLQQELERLKGLPGRVDASVSNYKLDIARIQKTVQDDLNAMTESIKQTYATKEDLEQEEQKWIRKNKKWEDVLNKKVFPRLSSVSTNSNDGRKTSALNSEQLKEAAATLLELNAGDKSIGEGSSGAAAPRLDQTHVGHMQKPMEVSVGSSTTTIDALTCKMLGLPLGVFVVYVYICVHY